MESTLKRIDTWLVRVSHISQFGLFILTIGALYYTVIPLYKTAALEESIARKESELSATENNLKKASERLQQLESDLYKRKRGKVVQSLLYESPYCSGLMTLPENREPEHYLGDNALKINSSKCFLDSFINSKAKETLSADDYKTLENTVNDISKNLDADQKKALSDISNLEIIYEDKKLPPSKDSRSHELKELDILIEKANPGFLKENKKEIAIERAKSDIEINFMKKVSEEISRVKEIKWNDDK